MTGDSRVCFAVQTPDMVFVHAKLNATKQAKHSRVVHVGSHQQHVPPPGFFDEGSIIIIDHEGLPKQKLQHIAKQVEQWPHAVIATTNMQPNVLPNVVTIQPPETFQQWATLLVSKQGLRHQITKQQLEHILAVCNTPSDVLCASHTINAMGVAHVASFPFSGSHPQAVVTAVGNMDFVSAHKLVSDMPKHQLFPVGRALHTFLSNTLLAGYNGKAKWAHKRMLQHITDRLLLCRIVASFPPCETLTKPALQTILHQLGEATAS